MGAEYGPPADIWSTACMVGVVGVVEVVEVVEVWRKERWGSRRRLIVRRRINGGWEMLI